MINIYSLFRECIKDIIGKIKFSYLPFPMKIEDDELHLTKTMDWLTRAYENGKGGVSSHYSLLSGKWLNPFPETTGYIIPTFFDYAIFSNDDRYYKIAACLADWLGDVQLENGACMQGTYNVKKGKNKPIVFNTGQNIFGFLRAYKETRKESYLNFAKKAGNFLVNSTDENGIWNKHLHFNLPSTYNSRTAWALLELCQLSPQQEFRNVAISNLEWIISQQTKNGWFRHSNFKPWELPNTHGVAYTIEGLLESFLLTEDQRYFDSAKLVANRFQRMFEIRKFIYTFWDENWKNHGKYLKNTTGKYICLTGNIQFSFIWMKLFMLTRDFTYLNSAFKMVDFIKILQNINTKKGGINGGIKGAFPIYGGYSTFKYPNWAAKFFADALMMKINLQKQELQIMCIEKK